LNFFARQDCPENSRDYAPATAESPRFLFASRMQKVYSDTATIEEMSKLTSKK
jgi:hypothetical protein